MRRLLASMMVVAMASPVAAAERDVRNLKIVFHLDLAAATGVGGPFGAIAVGDSTAVVATGACPDGQVAIVSVADPRRPALAATIPATSAADVDLRGPVAAMALERCSASAPGVVLYDTARPAEPAMLSQLGPATRSVSFAGPTTALLAGDRSVRVVDVSDPAAPSDLAVWTPPGGGPCRDVRAFDGGRRALAACGESVYELDLTSPSAPSRAGSVPGAAHRAVGVVLSDQVLGLASTAAGLRVLELRDNEEPQEVAVVQSPGMQAPHRVVASGELAFVAWGADGLRVLDLATPGVPVVARFLPAGPEPDIVAVALLPNHVLAVDAASGLWVVERPPEGSKDSNSDDVKVLLAFLGIGGLLAYLVVPRVARILAMAGAASARAGARRVA